MKTTMDDMLASNIIDQHLFALQRLRSVGNFKGALQLAETFDKFIAESWTIRFERARLLVLDGRAKEAINLFETWLSEDSTNPRAWHEFALILSESGASLDRQIQAYRNAVNRDSRNANWLVNLGVALQLAGQDEEAIKVWTDALAIDDNDITMGYLASAFLAAGDLERHAAMLRRIRNYRVSHPREQYWRNIG